MSSEVLSALSSLVAELSAEERAALAEMIRAEPERVAIIGMGGRFPGATDPEAFWRVLRDGTDCIREVPAQRWDIDAWYDPDPDAPGKMYSRWGGFLDGVDQFDAAFFELSPREAESMDPQQRLLLEVTWEALEDAGQIPSRLEGTRTGVYVGMCNVDYGKLVVSEDLTRTDLYTGSGNLRSVASGRISYLLGLQGPSITLDTACSSSLLAIHLAAESLRSGECSLALAGGVNLVLHPEYHVYLSRTRMMARDGRCKAFDARADGFVRSEGCGVVVLKRLSEALRDGDRILGVLRGTAANNDGRSSGLTAPNMIAQQAVLREALRNAGLSASDITHLETHGTGTALGDPIEFEALREVLGDPREDGSTCALGAAKTNLGHLEAAAGVVGLIKILLSMRHEAIPALVHFRKLNPRLSLEGTPFVIPTQLTPWPRGSKRRIAGVSSFGMSGTNVHVIVEEPSVRPVRAVAVSSTRPHLLVLSARTPEALRALAQTFREHLEALEQRPDMSLEDVLFSAAGRREHYEHRLAAVGTSAAELSAALGAHVRGSSHSGLVLGTVPQRGERPRVVFVFPGQGSQWVGMGRELLESEPVFRQALEACDAAIRPYTGVSVVEGLRAGSAELLERIDLIQPTLFALEVALAEQWRAWGVEPDAVVGHSMGEVAAACVAGALSLEDAARVICVRSRLLRKVSGKGAMAVVELTLEQAQQRVKGYEGRVSVAVSNSASSTVLSGEVDGLEELVKGLEAEGVFCRRVKVDVASHSPQMDVLRQELLEMLQGLAPRAGRVPMMSTVKVREVEGSELDAGYWVKNLREPVMFGPTVEKLKQTGHTLFVELSPHPILAPAIEPTLSGEEGEPRGVVVGSLRREQPERERMLESLGRLYAVGLMVDWRKLYPAGRFVSLPTYPWQRKAYWLSKPAAVSGGLDLGLSGGHPLHGRRIPSPGRELQFASAVSVARQPYMDDHRVFGAVVVPGAFHVAALISAAEEALGPSVFSLEGMEFQRALVLEEGQTHRLHLLLSPAEAAGEFSFQSASPSAAAPGNEETWRIHATGRLRVGEGAPASAFTPLMEARARCTQARPLADIYENLKARGIELGPDFAWVTELWRGEGEALGVIQRPSSSRPDSFPLHPSLVDSCFQVLLAAGPTLEEGKAYVPFSVDRIRFHRRGAGRLFCHVQVRAHETPGPEMCVADFRLFDEGGTLLADVEGFRIRQADPRKMLAAEVREPWAEWLYTPSWQQAAVTASPRSKTDGGGRWVLFVDQGGLAARVGSELQAHGFSCVRVQAGDAFSREGPSLYTVRPERAEDFSALVSALLQEGPPLAGAVFLWSADAPAANGMTPAALRAEQALGYGAVLHWSQAVARAALRQLPRLWLVTRDVHAVGGSSGAVSLAQAPLWGLGRTLFYEHPDLRCACVDLSAQSSLEEQSRGLAQELLAGGDEEEIALRPEGRFVGRVMPGSPGKDRAQHPITLKADGTYVLTGGLGGLGLSVARWLVARGARSLVLVGRQGADTPARQEAVAGLEAQGAKVHVAQADVADFAQLQAVLERAEGQLPPIKGVLHLAGVLEDGLLAQQDLERYRKVMGPKVLGAWNLHLLTRGKPLDFFVLYSAGAALLGTPGQGNYAAANAFLDALAHHRRALGLPGLSINWGAFAEVGLAAAAANRGARLAHRGVRSFSPDEAHAALEHLLGQDVAQVAVIAFDARQWMDYYPQAASSTRLSPVVKSSRERRVEPAKAVVREKLREARGAERASLLEQFVQEQVAAVARLAISAIERHAALKSFGMDSLMGLELRNQLERGLGLRLPATLVWTYPNVAALAEHLLTKIEPAPETPPAPAKAREVPAPAMVPISEAEKRALLEKELASLEELLR